MESFEQFDKDSTGFVTMEDFKKICTTMGERLTDEEVDELIKEMDLDPNGMLEYKYFIKILMAKWVN